MGKYFDKEQLNKNFMDDEEIISEIAKEFDLQLGEHKEAIKSAHAQGDQKSLEITFHTLKGICLNFFANELAKRASEFEQIYKAKGTAQMSDIELFLIELTNFKDELLSSYNVK